MPKSEKLRVQVYESDLRMTPAIPYLRDTLRHIRFAYEKAKLDITAAHKNTWFGRLWNILNPLLLSIVYWFLVVVLFGGGKSMFDEEGLKVLTHMVAGLFLYSLPSGAISAGSRSIIQGGAFILNTRLPRIILPISALITSILVFPPSMLVYMGFHALGGYSFTPYMLWGFPIIFIITLNALGLTLMASTGTVYFRDIASFLPYVIRICLYLTPIIFLYDQYPPGMEWALYVNPLGTLFASWQQILFKGTHPDLSFMLAGLGWTTLSLVAGVRLFLRKEREFAVRI